MRTTLCLMVALALGTGCDRGPSGSGSETPTPTVTPDPVTAPGQGQPQNPADSVDPGTETSPTPNSGPPLSFANASNALGFDLYAKARVAADRAAESGPENLAISPASISLAFDMALAGARGETATEMRRVMHVTGPESALHDEASRVLGRLNDPDREDYELRVVNRLFGEGSFTFDQNYLDLTRTKYLAPLEGVDFRGAPDGVRGHINGWVAEQTADRITDLLPPGSVDSDTRLVLVNAIYFLGSWATPFEESLTRPLPFHLPSGRSVRVPTMHRDGVSGFGRTDGVTVVELPYVGDELVMDLIIPDAIDGLPAVEERLDAETLSRWVAAVQGYPECSLWLPRFEMRTKVTLGEHLGALGMTKAFTRRVADFTGIANPPDPDDRLFISEAFHQVFVAVDEEGTEAAAATAIVMGSSGGGTPPPPVEVRADRPFLFVIRERASGVILFLGRITDPR